MNVSSDVILELAMALSDSENKFKELETVVDGLMLDVDKLEIKVSNQSTEIKSLMNKLKVKQEFVNNCIKADKEAVDAMFIANTKLRNRIADLEEVITSLEKDTRGK